uniref:GTPase HflX N-terminal domain-containing protein n=1 Tax=Lynx canadensis TaxID=61383 RepID=A0A667HGY8_LYNCA
MVVPARTPDGKVAFGRGTLRHLTEKIRALPEITAVFLNVERMAPPTKKELEAAWGVQVFDRFTVVLSIFRCNARTKEARLQVALAELPLLRSHLSGTTRLDGRGGGSRYIMGSGESLMQVQRHLLKDKELKIRRPWTDFGTKGISWEGSTDGGSFLWSPWWDTQTAIPTASQTCGEPASSMWTPITCHPHVYKCDRCVYTILMCTGALTPSAITTLSAPPLSCIQALVPWALALWAASVTENSRFFDHTGWRLGAQRPYNAWPPLGQMHVGSTATEVGHV